MRRTRDNGWRSAPEETITPCTGCGTSIGWSNEMCDSCLDEARDADSGVGR